MYEKGTGFYYDYYYDTSILKEKGHYRNGKKSHNWMVYNQNGKVIKKEYFIDGVLVNN